MSWRSGYRSQGGSSSMRICGVNYGNPHATVASSRRKRWYRQLVARAPDGPQTTRTRAEELELIEDWEARRDAFRAFLGALPI